MEWKINYFSHSAFLYFWITKRLIMKTSFNKFLYIGFILVGLFQAFFSKDYMQAASSFAIGLIFDPFDQEQKWNDRPTWQKAVLFVHLAVAAAFFGYAIGWNDK